MNTPTTRTAPSCVCLLTDQWIVLQGGRAVYDNAYAASDDNRYTVSFMALKDGMAFENDGKKNSDYYC